MKKVDLTKPVMSKIVHFEQRRIRIWLGLFSAVVFLLAIIWLSSLVSAGRRLGERHTLDLLTLFQEDREIIAEFWQDTLLTFWEELPQKSLLVTAIVSAAIAGLLVFTRGRRRIINRKRDELAKYQKYSNNKLRR